MRISSNTIFAGGLSRLSELQSGIIKTQQQISTGRRILTPSDDPVGAARALDLTQGQSINTQFAANRTATSNSLSTEEGVLQGTTGLLQDVKTLTISAGNGALNDSDRQSIATDLRGRLDELIAQANGTDGTGNYLFGGFQVASPPFSSAATGAVYSGDQGQRLVQVSTSRQIALSDPGDAIFQNIPTTAGTIGTKAAAANSGTGSVSGVTVTDATALVNHNYSIQFSVSAATPPVTTYDVLDSTAGGPALSTGNAYVAGQPISFAGQQLTVSGAPANGDAFTVQPAAKQSIFKTLSDLITALQTPATGIVGKANLERSLSIANGNIDNALNNVLTTRSSIGSRLKELDSLDTYGQDRDIQYETALQQIQGVDYNKAISDFTQQNITLEAAQKSFVKISGLSLFNLL